MISSNSWQFGKLSNLRHFIYREVQIAKFDKILDLGAGELQISKELSTAAKKNVFAIDLQIPSKIPDNVFFAKGDALFLPFSDKTFDAVTASFFFVWIKEINQALKEIKRVLKKEGKILFLSEPIYSERFSNGNTLFEKLYKEGLKKLGANFNIEKEFHQDLKKLGFKTYFKKTEGACLVSGEEILEEIEFLFERNIIDEKTFEILKAESKKMECEICLPILYGWAFLP